mgnify:CR=1 FL=1
MYGETEINEKAYLTKKIGLRDELTFYTLHPGLVPDIILYTAGIMLITGFLPLFRKKDRF